MKKITLSVLYAVFAGLTVVGPVFADGNEKVCYAQYGGGVICDEPAPEEAPVGETNTGVVENVMLAGGLFAAGYVLLAAANKYSQEK